MSEEEILDYDENIILDYDENIYQKLAQATARAIDINLGKTTLADLLDGYTKSRILQQKIDKAKEYLEKFIPIDIDTIILSERQRDYLLEILGDKE